MIQIGTVSTRTDVLEYWPADFFRTVYFEDDTMGKERTAHIARTESIKTAIERADYHSFIIEENPETMYDHPNTEVRVDVYDGYNE